MKKLKRNSDETYSHLTTNRLPTVLQILLLWFPWEARVQYVACLQQRATLHRRLHDRDGGYGVPYLNLPPEHEPGVRLGQPDERLEEADGRSRLVPLHRLAVAPWSKSMIIYGFMNRNLV